MKFQERASEIIRSEKFSYFGIIGSVAMLIALLIPQLTYVGTKGESFSMVNHFVSELGELGVSSLAMVFNIGIIIGGFFFLFFMIGLGLYLDSKIAKISLILGVISSACAILVGFFPMNFEWPHYIAAISYFNITLFTAIVITVAIFVQKEQKISKKLCIVGACVIGINLFSFIFINPSDLGDFSTNRPDLLLMAIIEWAMVLSVLGYLMVIAIFIAVKFHRNS